MAPSYALVRRLGGEEKFTAKVVDLYLLSNYDLTKFVPKNSKSFSASQLYGLKKADENGVMKVVKCKIILLKDSEEEITVEVKKGKLPRCEPARFESSVQHTEDLNLFEMKKETTSRSSSVKQPKPTINKALSGKYLKAEKREVDNKAQAPPEKVSKTTKPSGSKSSGSSYSSKDNDSQVSAQLEREVEGALLQFSRQKPQLQQNNKKKNNNEGRKRKQVDAKPLQEQNPIKKTKLNDLEERLSNFVHQNFPAVGKDEKSKSDTKDDNMMKVDDDDDDTTEDSKSHDGMTKRDKHADDLTADLNDDSDTENKSKVGDVDLTQSSSPIKNELRFDSICSPLCGSALMKKMDETLQKLAHEVNLFKEMYQDLQTILKDVKEQMSNSQKAHWSAATIQTSSNSPEVDLGGETLVDRDWAEKKVWQKNEPLKWKLEKVLTKIFTEDKLLHFWFDKTCIKEEEGDEIFPEDCIDKIHEFFDEANSKKSKMEILKQQSRARQHYSQDKEQCEKICQEIHASITMQTESLPRSEIRKQIGKVLFDIKSNHRKQNNMPPRKPRTKKED